MQYVTTRQRSHHRELKHEILAREATIKFGELSKVLDVAAVHSVQDTPCVATVAVVQRVCQNLNQYHVLLLSLLFGDEVLNELEIDHVVQRLRLP